MEKYRLKFGSRGVYRGKFPLLSYSTDFGEGDVFGPLEVILAQAVCTVRAIKETGDGRFSDIPFYLHHFARNPVHDE